MRLLERGALLADKPTFHFTVPPPLTGIEDYETPEEFRHLYEIDPIADPVGALRQRLLIDGDVSDVTIAASLAAIAAKGPARERWLAAFTSPLGKVLAMRGDDLNAALNIVLSFAPKPAS
jgi:hypothetical protein